MAARILIVDDDAAECRHIEKIVRTLGYAAESAAGGEAALARLARSEAPAISAIILDLVMPDLDGMAVLERLQRDSLSVPVIVQAAAGSADAAGSAMRIGAFDFLVKPASAERVKVSLANALKLGALEGEVVRMRRNRAGTLAFSDIVLDSPPMERVLRLAERAARSSHPVLIEGERGVGKELFARAIHGSSPRRGRPFVMLGCGSLADAAGESALFGDTASGAPRGKLAEASGGTLYLDEIGALPPSAQARLAGFLAQRDAGSPAAARPPRGDIRLIAGSNRPLIDLVAAGAFREDLFYRLSVTPIWLPPLRERRPEIPNLARGILARFAAEEGRSGIMGISPAAMSRLSAYEWPGNFRELENAVCRAMMLCKASELSPDDFPQIEPAGNTADGRAAATPILPRIAASGVGDGVADQEQGGPEPRSHRLVPDTRSAGRYGLARLLDECGEMRPFEVLEEEVIRFAIDHYGGHMSEVARRLGIGRSTLYRKIRDYGIALEPALLP